MKIASDGNFGTNAQTYFWKMDFPKQLTGPITVTWDWQFHCTNEIPADYDPTNNNYSGSLPGFDHGFTFSDYANRTAELNDAGDTVPNPNWKYSELSTPFRLSTYQDGRHNAYWRLRRRRGLERLRTGIQGWQSAPYETDCACRQRSGGVS